MDKIKTTYLPWSIFLFVSLLFTSSIIHSQDAYTPDFDLRKSIRQSVWEELKPLTPKRKQFLFNLVFKSNAYFEEYEKVATAKGYIPYKPATVITFFRATCEEIRDTKTYSNEDLKLQFNNVNLDNEDLSLSTTELQSKYDPLILKAMWLAQLAQSKNLNTGVAQNLAKEILENFNSGKDKNQNKVIAVTSKSNKAEPLILKNNNKIDDVILRTVTSYGLSGVYVTNKISVLYKNGDLFTSPVEPLEVFDIVASKKRKPNSWDRWRKKDGVIFVTRSKNKKVVVWKKWHQLRSGEKGFKLQGKFNAIDGFGGSKVINASTVYFDDQGRFAWKTTKGGNTVWKPIFTKSASAGTYEVNGYTITLNYNNGLSESFFFGLYPKDNQHFVIGANHFVPLKPN